jgi:hypothetical protein
VWKKGDTPTFDTDITHPGIANDMDPADMVVVESVTPNWVWAHGAMMVHLSQHDKAQ